MTSPDPQRAVELEDRIAAAARKPLANALDKLLSRATALWVETVGDLDAEATDEQAEAYQRQLCAMLTALPKGPRTGRVLGDLGAARLHGGEQASRDVGIKPERRVSRDLDHTTAAEVRDLPRRVGAAHAQARALLAANGVRRYSDAISVVATARGSLTTVDRTVRWAANRAIAEGATEVADAEQVPRVWVPEREACLHCLAYAGRVADPGGSFPAGLTYGDRPLDDEDVPNPPLHPHCRCRVQLWRGEDDDEAGVSFPDGLRREADRTVLQGRSEYASNPARLRAAERLLTAGVKAPASVRRRAVAAVASGQFQ